MKKLTLTILTILFSLVTYSQNEVVNGTLSVNGTMNAHTNGDAVLSFYNTDNSWQYMNFFQSNIRKAYVGLDNANNFVLAKENGGNFHILGGNLGLGIYNPTVKLDVDGAIKATGSFSGGKAYFQTTDDTQLRLYGTDTWAGIELKDTNGNDYFWFNGQHKTFSIGGGGSNVAGKKLHIEGGTSIGTTYRPLSVPTNGLAVQGNVGIGVNNPTDKLVVQTTDTERYIKFKAPNGEERFQFYTGGTGNPAQMAMYDADGTSRNVQISASGDSYFNLGNVGIGTNNPTDKFVVQTTDAERYIKFKAPNGEERFQFYTGGTGNPAEMAMYSEDGTSRNVQISASGTSYFNLGNVGIGTTAPSAKLQVNSYTGSGTAQSYGSITSFANSGDIGLYLGVANENIGSRGWGFSARSVGVNSSLDFIEKGLNGTRMTIASGGNVGIGTTTPLQKMHLNGNMLFENNTELRWKDASGTQRTILELDTNNDLFLGKSSGGNLIFVNGTSYTEQMRLDVNGNLGIGTTAPVAGYKLSVAGKVIAEEIKVQLQSAWPDYVFANDYKLLSVEEVDAFIKKNGHLPKMPSAKQVEKEGGILLGDMNKRLLEKVEELTLYTIEQEKKIKALEKQNKRIELLEEQMRKLLNEKEK